MCAHIVSDCPNITHKKEYEIPAEKQIFVYVGWEAAFDFFGCVTIFFDSHLCRCLNVLLTNPIWVVVTRMQVMFVKQRGFTDNISVLLLRRLELLRSKP
jgi:hypothetical protein